MKKALLISLIFAMALGVCGCDNNTITNDRHQASIERSSSEEQSKSESLPSSPVSEKPPASEEPSEPESQPEPEEQPDPAKLPTVSEYIQSVVREHTSKILTSGMSDYEKVKAAFDHLLEIGTYADPPALDVWRWRTSSDRIPTREEMRGLNMLLFGADTCEGFAAALNMLLDDMGVETRYMTGLTYLARGGLGYHSWSQVKIDGVWYHIDPNLEDLISRSGTVNYKYFLRGDDFMRGAHYWGQRLINTGLLADEQNEEIAEYYMGEDCPRDYPRPEKNHIPPTEPDVPAIQAQLREELEAYEEKYGKLEYIDLGTEPPVFVNYYLDKRGVPGVDQDLVTFAEIYQATHCLIRKPGTEDYDLSMLPANKRDGYATN